MHKCKLGGEEVEDFVNCVIVVGELDIDINVVFVSGVNRVDAGYVVIFNEHRAVGGCDGLEGKWALEVMYGRWVVEVDEVGG